MKGTQAVLILVLLLKGAEGDAKEINYKRWMDRFLSRSAQEFLRSLRFLPTNKKTLHSDNKYIKKDDITPQYDSITKTDVQNIPSTEQTKRMMFVLFGDDGLFIKDHFKRSGEIDIEGPALMTVWKIFPNKSVLLSELQTSKNASIGSSVFSVLTQMLFLPEDISKLEIWLMKGIESGDEENNIPCNPKVVINYKCCEAAGEPILAPEFGSIEMGID